MKFQRTLLIMAGLLISVAALADHNSRKFKTYTYEVTVTNVTAGQSFTPMLVATHTSGISFFDLGEEPSMELADLAEGGATGGLQAVLDSQPGNVMDTANGMTLIGPGESETVYITANRYFNRLSLAGMLLPSNDSFVAINSMALPYGQTGVMALAYDAGSEMNDELCANIPGPTCGGTPFSAGLAEGYVHISRGISGAGDLAVSDYDWRNPVAHVSVVRMD